MSIIALLITISLTIALLFLGIFLWSMKSGQYDDTYTPSVRMLFDDKPVSAEPTESPGEQPLTDLSIPTGDSSR
jgi:cbb3-type cytochrome oxidase maturation protein